MVLFITQVPEPVLAIEVAPVPLLAKETFIVLSAVLLPVSVTVRAVLVPDSVAPPVLENTTAPVPEASIVAPAVPTVKRRLVESPAPA